jgi:hypothetical protein
MEIKYKLFTKREKKCVRVQTCVRTSDKNYEICVTDYVFEITQTFVNAAAKLCERPQRNVAGTEMET